MSRVQCVLYATVLLSASFIALVPTTSCVQPPTLNILSPFNGAMIDASTLLVTGNTNSSGDVFVNGVLATDLPGNAWEATIPLDTVAVINPIDVELVVGGMVEKKRRITVLAGPSIAEGLYSQDAVAIGFTNTGLQALTPLVSSLAGDALDISSLLLTGAPIFDGQIMGINVTATAYDADIGSFDFTATTDVDQVLTSVTINGLSIAIDMDIDLFGIGCKVEVDMTSADIDSVFDMSPDPVTPTLVDVNQVGDAVVNVNGVTYQFIDGPCDPDAPIIGPIINALVGDQITGLIPEGFKESLKDPDGAGPLDSPIAQGVEDALAGISIAGEVGNAVGLTLDAPIQAITEDLNGLVLNADASFLATVGTGIGECDAPASAPDLTESFDVPSSVPSFGALTPGGLPYSLGLSISSSGFNQLFKGMIECGLMVLDVTEVDFGGLIAPVSTDLLALLGMPEFVAFFGSGVPMTIRIEPTMAPLVTGAAGPGGEMAQLGLPYLLMKIIHPVSEVVWITIAIDTSFGLDLAFDPVLATLTPTVTPPGPADTLARVIDNRIGAQESAVEGVLPTLLPLFFAAFGDVFGSFPLPTFFGLQLEVVEIEAANGLFNLYTNLLQTPQTRIENVVLTDSSSTDFVTDDVFDNNEWRHKTKVTATPAAVDVRYRSLIAGDACCTVDDEHVNATADYRVEFDVIPENGDTWQLDINHRILGALTTVDEANAVADGSELAEFTSPIQGSYSIDGGMFIPFDFNPSPSSVFDDFGGAEDDINAEVTGANNVRLIGTTQSHIVLDFSWSMHVFSDSNAITPAIDGGEGAIRLGMHDTIELGTAPVAGFSAGHYPGQGNRDITADGHFIDIDLTAFACMTGQPGCAICGDGVITSPEVCDDGNGVDGDGCDGACGFEAGFNCAGEPSSCTAICGDGLIRGTEGCDDSNTSSGDGCSMMCQVESGWTCTGEPSSCVGTCGDGIPVGSEQCDDGNPNYGDGCRPTCTSEICGDGIIDPGEQCDDGNTSGGDGCDSACTGLDSGCQMGGNNCRNFNDGFSFGRNCTTSTLCIGSAGWYLLQGTTNGTSLNDYDIQGQPHNLNDIETAQTRTDYHFLSPGTYTVEACDNTGLGISTSPYCVLPADRVSAPGSVSGSLNDSPDLDSGTGEIDLAGPISGGDQCYVVDVVRTGNYRINATNHSGGGLLAAGLYSGTPPSGLITAAGQSPSPIPVGAFGTSGYVTLTQGTTYHLCADTATLGSNISFTLALEAQ